MHVNYKAQDEISQIQMVNLVLQVDPRRLLQDKNPRLTKDNAYVEECNAKTIVNQLQSLYNPEKVVTLYHSSRAKHAHGRTKSGKSCGGNIHSPINLVTPLHKTVPRPPLINQSSGHGGKQTEFAANLTSEVKVPVSPAADLSATASKEKRLFDHLNAHLMPVTQIFGGTQKRSQKSEGWDQHREWLESIRHLSRTKETEHVDYLFSSSTSKTVATNDVRDAFSKVRIPTARRSPAVIKWPTSSALRRIQQSLSHSHQEDRDRWWQRAEDVRDAFSKVRIPTARRSPAVIKWPTNSALRRIKQSPSHSHHEDRDRWWQRAEGEIRVDKCGIGSARFHSWSGFDDDKVKATTCFFLRHATGPPPAHQAKEPPKRTMHQARQQLDYLEKKNLEKRKEQILRRDRTFIKSFKATKRQEIY
ncbi:hypothetical protein PoB_005209400 [Plakobranchus ocellatus]|uniref:ALMS motif domain-containing protein n=1 Tax=Plakobranchus ocellatus TaxID=259542 RepID=A0AAV4C4H1_9GAST|nr:hypothetical protein PoB_005209400 [Plakobranchus ocellatus]